MRESGAPMNGVGSLPYQRGPRQPSHPLLPREVTGRRQLPVARKWAVTRQRTHGYLDLAPPSLQNSEK